LSIGETFRRRLYLTLSRRRTMKRYKVLAPVLVLALLLGAMTAVSASAVAPDRTTLPGSAPAWANARNYAGPADPNADVGFRVYLGWVHPDAAVALARAVSDPASASYGKYLTPAQFRNHFSPSASDVAKVQNWLRRQGFDVQYTPQNNHYVSAEGTVAQAQAAFGADFGLYDVQGKTVRSPSADVSIPSELAGIVNGV
jgi:subtilase family serine protease